MAIDVFALPSVSNNSPSWGSPIAIGLVPGDGGEGAVAVSTRGHLMLFNKHSTAIVEYSFDGSALHGELDPSDGTRGKTFDDRHVDKIWLRIKTGSTGPANVSVEGWLTR